MAQTGYTPILIYSSSTTSNVPSAGNLTNSTLGSELAINITDGKLFYKDNANNVQVIGWKTVPTTAGGTGLTSYSQGDLLYYNTGTTLTVLSKNTTATRYLSNTGSNNNPAWAQVDLSNGVTGTLPAGNGGTGITSLGTGIATFLGTPSSANLAAAVTDETGSGSLVFATSPTFTTPTLGAASATSVAFGAGAGGTPSMTATGDLNTGFWFPTADTIAASTGGTERWRIGSDGSITMPTQPAFRAELSASQANVTGDGTTYSLAANIWTEIYDQGADFSPTTGTFTAPVTGRYTFTMALTLYGVTAADHTNGTFSLIASNRTTTFYSNPGTDRNSSLGGGTWTLTTEVDMDASDTFYVSINVGNVGKTVGVFSTTVFTGHLIC